MNAMSGTPSGLSGRLKAATSVLHGALDERVLALRPFESRVRYVRFLLTQHAFFVTIEPLYRDPRASRVLAEGVAGSRLAKAEGDLHDLGVVAPRAAPPPLSDVPFPDLVGWLYVAEGSKLGAAFLLKEAEKLGLGKGFGARHLGPHPEGRGLEWRRFVGRLDAAALSPREEEHAIAAAAAAFAGYRQLLEETFAARPPAA
ncbi:MAG: biliverdin-producing heme oxygenase [Pararhizobium sp.]